MSIGFTFYPTGAQLGAALTEDMEEAHYGLIAFGEGLSTSDEEELVDHFSGMIAEELGHITRLRDLLTKAIEQASCG